MSPRVPDTYLAEVLALDPQRDAQEIVALRARALGLDRIDTATAEAHADHAERRERALLALREVHDSFYAASPAELTVSLDAIGELEEPDLQQWARRLRRAVAARPQLDALHADRRIDRRESDRIRALAIASPAEFARLGLRHLDGTRTDRARLVAGRVRKRYPDVHALAPDHFERMVQLKRERALSKPAAAIGGVLTFWVIFQIIRVLWKTFGAE